MSKKSYYLLGIILTIIIGSLLHWWLCCSVKQSEQKPIEQEQVMQPEIKEATSLPFAIKDDDTFEININENFNFQDSGFEIIKPISENLNASISRLQAYLAENPTNQLNITGLYTTEEGNTSVYPNLGLARANAVKNYLNYLGISSKQINTSSALKDDLIPNTNNVYVGPLTYAISEADTLKEDALVEVCDAIKESPLLLYFGLGEATIQLSDEQREKIADISKCVDKLNATVLIIGHTDNTGDASRNIALGKSRADFAKDYFIKNGISEASIETSSEGQSQPIADNATEEGREKNRRIVITIK